MAPLPPSNTVRVYLDYTSKTLPHTAEFRLSGTPAVSVMQAAGLALANIFLTRMFSTDSITLLRYSPAGEDFTLPIPTTPQSGVLTEGFAAQWQEDPESVQTSLCGRGTAIARRWRISFFTPYAWAASAVAWPAKNRYLLGANSAVDAFITELQDWAGAGYGASRVVTIGGDTIATKNYLNIRKNSYWQDEQRN